MNIEENEFSTKTTRNGKDRLSKLKQEMNSSDEDVDQMLFQINSQINPQPNIEKMKESSQDLQK